MLASRRDEAGGGLAGPVGYPGAAVSIRRDRFAPAERASGEESH
jgi:hypothetical protein